MKINFKEYEEMVERFNLYVFRWVYVFLPIVVWLISFLVVYFDEGEVVINFIVCTIMAVVFQKISKKIIITSAKKVNRTNKVVELETMIYDDYIEEVARFENGVDSTSKYYFRDFMKVREDKHNFYLFIINNAAIIINKQKLENIEVFRKQIQDKCVMIKK